MSERRLKLGHRKEYKRKSKHTRNPSYYPRHLTKVTLADFDADFNLRVSKEVAAQRGYGRKVLDKSCHIANKLLSLITTGFIFRFHVAKEVI